jgi:mannobiose 2-epimerase
VLEKSLKSELLDVWYPRAIDSENGGFLSDFTYEWQAKGRQNKMIVTQTRHVWTSSQAAMFYGDEKYRKIAEHGFRFLRDKLWDKIHGGFYMYRSREGGSPGFFGDGKSAYGNAFAVYALAGYFKMSGDSSALELAKKTFLWLEKHSHDAEYKGYYDNLNRDGSLPAISQGNRQPDWKDYNSSIHLLEAFSGLYKVWPDALVRARLLEMLGLIRDKMTHGKGYLLLNWSRDWQHVSFKDEAKSVREANYFLDHVSFGHDVETAFLLLEASNVLGLENDKKTLAVAKTMVEHSLTNGWDEENGGLYYEGYYHPEEESITIINDTKTWWVQAEALNAFLLMAKLFPAEKKYYIAFEKEWQYIDKYLIDHQHGDWYEEGLDNSPDMARAPKGRDWKVNYHNTRALINCIKMLKSEFELTKNAH